MHVLPPPPFDRARPTRPRVIICDHSAKTRQHLQALLGPDYQHVMAESGEEALRLATTTAPPDLMLVDVKLPGYDGYELCRRARADERLEKVPLILLTAAGAADDARAQALESGADDALSKPVRPREIRARVAALLRLRFMATALEARAQELEAANRFLTQARVALVHTEKLATIGTLVAGVAQEVNNPLAFIRTGVDSLRDYLGDLVSLIGRLMGSPSEQDREEISRTVSEAVIESKSILAEIGEGAHRLHQISQDLKLIAAEDVPDPEEVDVEEEISRTWKVALLRAKSKPELVVVVDRFQPVRVPAPLLRQVLLSLFVNAVQALEAKEGGGTVWVSAQEVDGEILIAVRDNGPGIPEKLRNRIFDPFFTTRQPGQGAGLGLSVSDSIMRSLGGSIEVAEREGPGAELVLRLPAVRAMAADYVVVEEPLG
ncbi:MAG TPA: ATP-binding protein [Myxococcales bacterium]|nr:ATP-binding protein [Myxococcales bacterium]